MQTQQIKLPKQWKHWCKKANLSVGGVTKHKRIHDYWFYLKGRGFYWRITCYAEFQISDCYKDFDRWANCGGFICKPIPKTESEFIQTVKLLLEERKDYDNKNNL